MFAVGKAELIPELSSISHILAELLYVLENIFTWEFRAYNMHDGAITCICCTSFFLRNAHFDELINLVIIWLKKKNPKNPPQTHNIEPPFPAF